MIIIILFLILIMLCPFTYCESSFAQVLSSQSYLYVAPKEENSNSNIICLLEPTYFVEVVLTYDETFYKVNYNGISGYVKRKDVKKVTASPHEPYPSANLVTINNNIYLRKSPEKRDNNNIVVIPANTASIRYIGQVYGEQLDDFRDNIWYYVEFEGKYGYIYGEYIKSITDIFPNVEPVSFITNLEYSDMINPLSDGKCAMIVFLLTLPTILIVLVIYSKPSKRKKQTIKIKEIDE